MSLLGLIFISYLLSIFVRTLQLVYRELLWVLSLEFSEVWIPLCYRCSRAPNFVNPRPESLVIHSSRVCGLDTGDCESEERHSPIC